jgi:hypothetical protein
MRTASTTRARADQRGDGVAAVQGEPGGQHRLVLDMRVDAVAVAARHIAGGEQAQARMRRLERRHVAEGEARMGVRRSDSAEEQRAGGHVIGSIAHSAVQLAQPVHAGQAGADGADLRAGAGSAHRLDDAAIAGAAAKHAAQRRLDLGLVGHGDPAQQFGRGDDHARRADAALRRAGGVEARHQRLALGRGGDALDRLDRRTFALAERGEAGAGLGAVHQHGAGAAIAGVAADLGAEQAEALAQGFGQPRAGRHRDDLFGAVQDEPREGERSDVVHAASRARARATSSSAAAPR